MPESCCCGAEGCPVCRPDTVSRIAELEAENQRLREALRDALDGYQECASYKGDYLYNKHGDAEEIARLQAALKQGEG